MYTKPSFIDDSDANLGVADTYGFHAKPSFVDDSEINSIITGKYESKIIDYNTLGNKPEINGVTLQDNLDSSDLKIIYRGTTAYWNNQSGLISEKNAIYVYTDYQEIDNGDGTFTILPAIKIGDGTSYLIDMPIASSNDTVLKQHLEDCVRHITAEERDFWNRKWSGYINSDDPENLCFTTSNIVLGDNIHA